MPKASMDWVTVPGGAFRMGSAVSANVLDEAPEHTVTLAPFQILRTPVTNAQYQEFVRQTRHAVPGNWMSGEFPDGQGDQPVTHVDWYDASAFAQWAGARLPTEAEWEKAARGTDGRTFPWGEALANSTLAHFARPVKNSGTCSVFEHPNGASMYGALDMAGNVWEWVSSIYQPYPFRTDDGRENAESGAERVLRGGSFYSGDPRFLRCATRSASYPTRRRDHIGFRIAKWDKKAPHPQPLSQRERGER